MAVAISSNERVRKWLADCGIVLEGQHARRVLIDVTVGQPTRVYVEQFGDEKMFDLRIPDCVGAAVTFARELAPSVES